MAAHSKKKNWPLTCFCKSFIGSQPCPLKQLLHIVYDCLWSRVALPDELTVLCHRATEQVVSSVEPGLVEYSGAT